MTHFSLKKKLFALNSLIMLFWWLAFNPGFYSLDSFGVLNMARSGDISNSYTAIWAIFVKCLTFNGSQPEVATLFFSQLLGYSVSIFSLMLFRTSTALWSSAILCATPLVGGMGITLWHDIPMTSGFLLMLVGAKKIERGEKNALYFFIAGSVFSSFRYNGLPTLILAVVILLFFTKNKRGLGKALILMLLVACLTTSLNLLNQGPKNVQSDGFIDWMRYDLSCYAAISNDEKFFRDQFDEGTTVDDWSSKSACNWFNESRAFAMQSKHIDKQIPEAWLALAMKNPLFLIETHLQRHKYLVPVPFAGIPTIPFIHTTIELPNLGVQFLNPAVSESLRPYLRSWNFLCFIFGNAGLWLSVILFISWRKKNLWLFNVGLVGLILNLGLLVFATVSEARFSLFVLIAGQLILVGEVIERTQLPSKLNTSFRSLTSRES